MLAPAVSLLAAACVTANAPGADALPPFPRGLYGNVAYARGSGDLGGFEVRFFAEPATGQPMAEFTLCEGWCNRSYTAEDGPGFAFSHVEELVAYDGDTPTSREQHRASYRVVPAGRELRVFHAYDGEPFNPDAPWHIKPLKREYGLAVARRDGGSPLR